MQKFIATYKYYRIPQDGNTGKLFCYGFTYVAKEKDAVKRCEWKIYDKNIATALETVWLCDWRDPDAKPILVFGKDSGDSMIARAHVNSVRKMETEHTDLGKKKGKIKQKQKPKQQAKPKDEAVKQASQQSTTMYWPAYGVEKARSASSGTKA